MGNSNTKETRSENPDGSGGRDRRPSLGNPGGLVQDHGNDRSSRTRRADLNFLGLGTGSGSRDRDPNAPFERRETKQEREARRLERERIARAKERERSLAEEHIDGGYLVTLGTYTGPEDFSKPVVRQLQIDRKLAPFWRGLEDWSDNWAEHQLIAAARGLPVPAADAPPDPDLIPRPPPVDPQTASNQNLHSLTVPMGPRTLSAASDHSASGVGSSASSPAPTGSGRTSSPFKPRAKAIAAALSGGSRNGSTTDLTPKEISMPYDPFVNGQPLEVFLYKDAIDCPICFLSYPPYLNRTRCCDQPICSECFVQIKRTDPHLPEHHPDGQARDPNEGLTPEDPPEILTTEPSACPYCQQPEFGVTYDAPPFRRGLIYAGGPTNPSSATAMSSQSSLNSTLPNSPSQPGRRRAHSLSANAPNVVTTDRVRPDWASKLASARAHQARRSAAATALHTAAFLMGGNEPRSMLRPSRFGRRTPASNASPVSTPPIERQQPSNLTQPTEGPEPGARGSSRNVIEARRNRMDDLEQMMFMEAVRLSLAAEEERKRKEEKAFRKDAKKREKEERKALKKQGGNPYSGGTSGASASSLSLGLGRRRGNSTTSNLRVEATVQSASQAVRGAESPTESKEESPTDKGKGVDRGVQDTPAGPSSSSSSLPIPSGPPRGSSHLRQMSNASSIGSSNAESPTGSLTGHGYLGADSNGPRSSGLSLGAYSDDGDRDAGGAGVEPMFNFHSLAQMVGANIEGGSVQHRGEDESEDGESPGVTVGPPRPLSQVKEEDKEEAEAEHVEERGVKKPRVEKMAHPRMSSEDRGTKGHRNMLMTPEVTITPGTPAPMEDAETEHKQLGYSSITEHASPFAR
ncbi:hypothetical protein G7046_g2504 [Stylonectria norvegica]|nr:hypothetical protein G7046_g2504 [Stylonectria norvegica]